MAQDPRKPTQRPTPGKAITVRPGTARPVREPDAATRKLIDRHLEDRRARS